MVGKWSRTVAIDDYLRFDMQFLCKNAISVSAGYSRITLQLQ
jgi:hypothetical protein